MAKKFTELRELHFARETVYLGTLQLGNKKSQSLPPVLAAKLEASTFAYCLAIPAIVSPHVTGGETDVPWLGSVSFIISAKSVGARFTREAGTMEIDPQLLPVRCPHVSPVK